MSKYHIARMACGGCEENVRKTIAAVDPAATVEIDLGAKTVAFQSSSISEIEAALAAAGYPVEAIPG